MADNYTFKDASGTTRTAGAEDSGSVHYNRFVEKQYAMRVDEVSSSLSYVGVAEPGSATASAVWRIYKIASTAGVSPIITWADGNVNLDNIWDNRAALTYS